MKKILPIIFIFISINAFSQETFEMWVKLSPEIKINFENSPLEIRWRPDDHFFLPEKYLGKNNFARTDIMLGLTIWKFKIFSYSKFDEFGKIWTGPRVDFNTKALNKKLLINIQTRYFWGLNDKSSDHYYLIQYPRYIVAPKTHLGILSYGKWASTKEFNTGNWFVGPSAQVFFTKNLSSQISLTMDVFHTNIWMSFLRIAYNIKFGTNKQTTNED